MSEENAQEASQGESVEAMLERHTTAADRADIETNAQEPETQEEVYQSTDPVAEAATTEAQTKPSESAPKKFAAPERKPRNAAERIAQRRERELKHLQEGQSDLQQRHDAARNELSAISARNAEVQRLRDSGDQAAALKAAGFGTVAELQKQDLQRRGLMPAADPRIDALQAQLDRYESADRQRADQYHQAQEKQRGQAEHESILEDTRAEIAALDYENSEAISKVPEFVNLVQQVIQNQEFETVADASNAVYAHLRPQAKALLEAYPDLADELIAERHKSEKPNHGADHETPSRRGGAPRRRAAIASSNLSQKTASDASSGSRQLSNQQILAKHTRNLNAAQLLEIQEESRQ